jgi:hypothetical protein
MYQVKKYQAGKRKCCYWNYLGGQKVDSIYLEGTTTTKLVISSQEYHFVPGFRKEMLSLGKLIDIHPQREWHTSCVNEARQMECSTCKPETGRKEQDSYFSLRGRKSIAKEYGLTTI